MINNQKEKFKLQSIFLKKLITEQKEKLQKEDFTKKVVFLINTNSYYQDMLSELEDMMTVSETLLICGQYHRAMHYICITQSLFDNIEKNLEKDFEIIKRKFEQAI